MNSPTVSSGVSSDKFKVRKKFLINPAFQLSLIRFNIVVAILAIGLFFAENYYLLSATTLSSGSEYELDPLIQQIAQADRRLFMVSFWITAGLVLLAVTVGGLILSNRVAGPLHRLKIHMRDVSDGKTTANVKFRKKDYFPELAETYNSLLQAILRKK